MVMEDSEIVLASGDLRLKVSPFGASLRGLWREKGDGTRQEIITNYTGAKGKVGGQGDVLIPFPGRVRAGTYAFDGTTYQMAQNDKDGPNAIHGFLRLLPWEIESQSEASVRFTIEQPADAHPGYPFALKAAIVYSLGEGLTCEFEVTNIGDTPAPVAAGFHPYFTVGSEHIDTDLLQIPMRATLEFENLIPTGTLLPVEGTPFDFRQQRVIGDTKFNTCYLDPIRDPDGKLRIGLSAPDSGNRLTVWMDEAFDYLVVYSGDPLPDSHRRRSLAIEPMTCASDGFNHPEWGLVRLEPGQSFAGRWGVE